MRKFESRSTEKSLSPKRTAINKSYALDGIPSDIIVGAYALHKIVRSYNGSLIRVALASSPSTQKDIGFDSNEELDKKSLLDFVGNDNAYVVTWYDQNGNLDITQSDPNLAPYILRNGFSKINNKYAIDFYINKGLFASYREDLNTSIAVFRSETAIFKEYHNFIGSNGYNTERFNRNHTITHKNGQWIHTNPRTKEGSSFFVNKLPTNLSSVMFPRGVKEANIYSSSFQHDDPLAIRHVFIGNYRTVNPIGGACLQSCGIAFKTPLEALQREKIEENLMKYYEISI